MSSMQLMSREHRRSAAVDRVPRRSLWAPEATREQTPICVHPASGPWSALRSEDVEEGLTRSPVDMTRQSAYAHSLILRCGDGPAHTGGRRATMPTLTNRAAKRFRDRAQQIVDAALAGKDRCGERGSWRNWAFRCDSTSPAPFSAGLRWVRRRAPELDMEKPPADPRLPHPGAVAGQPGGGGASQGSPPGGDRLERSISRTTWYRQ